MSTIAVLVGSLRKESLNHTLAKNLEELASEGTRFQYVDLRMPLFNQDMETEFPAEAQAAKDIIEAADGVLFITPEYNRSIPGVLKNAIDWLSRPWGKNSLAGKPAGIVGASISVVGTAVAQADLRHILVYLGVKLLGQPEVYFANAHELFDENGEVVETSRDFLKNYIDTFVAWTDQEK